MTVMTINDDQALWEDMERHAFERDFNNAIENGWEKPARRAYEVLNKERMVLEKRLQEVHQMERQLEDVLGLPHMEWG